jgi:hypothetical protein
VATQGSTAYLTGCGRTFRGRCGAAAVWRLLRHPAVPRQERSAPGRPVYPFDTGCLPLRYGGNLGVKGVSHRGVCIPLQHCLFTPELRWQSRGQCRFLLGNACGSRREKAFPVDTSSTLAVYPCVIVTVATTGVMTYLTGVTTGNACGRLEHGDREDDVQGLQLRQVSERYPLIPLQHCLLTPEL